MLKLFKFSIKIRTQISALTIQQYVKCFVLLCKGNDIVPQGFFMNFVGGNFFQLLSSAFRSPVPMCQRSWLSPERL